MLACSQTKVYETTVVLIANIYIVAANNRLNDLKDIFELTLLLRKLLDVVLVQQKEYLENLLNVDKVLQNLNIQNYSEEEHLMVFI